MAAAPGLFRRLRSAPLAVSEDNLLWIPRYTYLSDAVFCDLFATAAYNRFCNGVFAQKGSIC